ncbi:MAG: low molecular weight protein-tyrosine-phosphatase [Butyricicoccus sp.]|nr:low molecular weight protein-tyrosine-phosphatase [Butyricicoccus sp.]
MVKILFVCHGNICRSPMAEFVMKDMVKKTGLEDAFYIESAAISAEELGNPVYPPARQLMERHGLQCMGKVARQMKKRDYDAFDLLIGMDGSNLRGMHRICGEDVSEKMHLLLDYTDHPRDVADPWYTRDFEATWRDVQEGCAGLLKYLCKTVDSFPL